MAIKQQSKVENKPPQTANDPPNRRAFALTASTAPEKRSPRGAFRAPLNEWKIVPPTCAPQRELSDQNLILAISQQATAHAHEKCGGWHASCNWKYATIDEAYRSKGEGTAKVVDDSMRAWFAFMRVHLDALYKSKLLQAGLVLSCSGGPEPVLPAHQIQSPLFGQQI